MYKERTDNAMNESLARMAQQRQQAEREAEARGQWADKQPTPSGQVTEALGALQVACEYLVKATSGLESRLATVLFPAEEEDNKKLEYTDFSVPMAVRIGQMSERVYLASHRLDKLLQRVSL